MANNGTPQRRHNLLAIMDRQANIAVEQALPALVNADLLSAGVTKFVPALDRDRPFHRHRFVSDQNDTDELLGPNSPCSTPEKLPVSIEARMRQIVQIIVIIIGILSLLKFLAVF
jgi:hypothetical protein